MKPSPDDLKEDLIHSLQKHVEVDEPEAAAPAQIASASDELAEGIVEAAEEDVVTFDRMSEEELLAGIEGLVAPRRATISSRRCVFAF